MSKPKLFLIDANSFCYRAYYAVRNLSTSDGQPTNAVFGFVNMLKKILNKEKPEYLATCFDVSRKTFRQDKFTEYKVHRPAMPDDLKSQMPIIKEVIAAYNIPIFEMEGFEADDVIATLAKNLSNKNLDVYVVSQDKDILQIVDKHIKVYNPNKDGLIYKEDDIKTRFKISPDKIADLIGLMGDATDNIPGVRGIGEMTAIKLLEEFGSLDNLYKNINKVKSEKLRELLLKHKNEAIMSKELALLDKKVPIEFEIEGLKVKDPDYDKLVELFKKLEFKSLLRELPGMETKNDSINATSLDEKNVCEEFLKDFRRENKELAFLIALQDSSLKLVISGLKNDACSLDFKNISFMKPILEDEKISKIVQDLKTTLIALRDYGVDLKGDVFDVMLAAYLIDPAKNKYDIEDLTWEYLEKTSLRVKTALLTKLKPALEEILKEREQLDLFCKVEIPLAKVLAAMQITGIAIDNQLLADLSKKLDERLKKLISAIYRDAGDEFNINSPKQLSVILFEKLKLPVIKKTKTGFSTDEEVLRRLSDKHAIVGNILEYRQLMKLKTTYVDTLPELVNPNSGRIHTSFNQTVTETGRLSSSSPNLQNIPIKTDIGRQIRKAFVPGEKDFLLLSADYSQIELRILAHLSKDSALIKAFNEDKDIHTITASLIFNKKLDDINQKMRDTAKRINFGITYGMSSFGLAKDLAITQEEAQNFIDAYFLRYPKVKDYMQKQIKLANKEGFVKTLLGRRRYLPQIKSTNVNIRQFAERQAINTPVQGSAADLIKLAMIDIQKEIEEKKMGSRLLLQVHDELVFEFPKNEQEALIKSVRHIMENVLKLSIPIKVDIKTGKNWLEMEDQ